MKAKVKCPVCGCPDQHVYTVPGHPKLKAPRIEIMNLKYQGVTICCLVTCAKCGVVFDMNIAKEIGKPKKKPDVAS